MASPTVRREAPSTRDEAAELLRGSAEGAAAVRIVGAATKLGWGAPVRDPAVELSTRGLDRLLEHNEGDLTAVLEAGVPLADAQRRFASSGQMLSVDPPLGAGEAATVGGVFATADAGPLRHRYGAPRDLIVGIVVALSDGTVARAGGKVIKNVAGYDLAKLFTGAFGTLGLIVEVSVRLHPRPEVTATARADSGDPDALAAAAAALAHSPLELEALDVRWDGHGGAVLGRAGGAAAAEQARAAVEVMAAAAAVETGIEEDDDELWAAQRAGQRAAEGGLAVRVSARQSRLADVLRAATAAGGAVVGRAAHGVCWVTLAPAEPDELTAAVRRLRADLAPCPCVVTDAPEAVRGGLDPWDERDEGRLRLSRRLKERFDPAGVCNPGLFVGGI